MSLRHQPLHYLLALALLTTLGCGKARGEFATTICDAVNLSGAGAETDPHKRADQAFAWADAHVQTTEAKHVMSALRNVDRAMVVPLLREGAKSQGGFDGQCALVGAFEQAYGDNSKK